MTLKVDNYFGGCPHCGRTDGCTNVGPSHWYFCKAHKTKWCIGSNLFSSWKEQTEDEQRHAYDAIGMGVFTEVEPLPCNEFVSKANLLPDTGKRYPSDAAPGRMPAHKGGDESRGHTHRDRAAKSRS